MNERIKEVRLSLDMTQDAFGKRLGIARNTVANYETSNRVPSNQIVLAICREFNVNEEWLRTGNGSMYMELSRAELAAKIVGNALTTDDEFIQNTFIALGQLSPTEWDVIKKFVEKLKS